MRYSVDRIENGMAVLISDDENERILPLTAFDFAVHEGMVLKEEDGVFSTDVDEESERREKAADLLKKILDKNEKDGL